MSRDFIRSIAHADVGKYNHSETRDPWIRLYCTASATTHGGNNARYALQIFAPLKLTSGREGRDCMIATASLSPRDLIALRADIDAVIVEVEEVYPHVTSPRYDFAGGGAVIGGADHTVGYTQSRAVDTKKRGS